MSDICNFEIIQGSSFSSSIYAMNGDGTYMNLSGYAARCHLKYKYSDTGYLTNLNPYIYPTYISGLIILSGNSIDTAALPATKLKYDLEVYDSGNYVVKILRGSFDVIPEVSNL